MLLKGLEQIAPKKQQEGEFKSLPDKEKTKENSKVSPFQKIADRIKEKKKQQQRMQIVIKKNSKQIEVLR